jgi:hypothetical protein
MQPLARPQFALQPDRSSLWGTCFKTHSARPSTTGQFIVSKKATNYSRGALITSNALDYFFIYFINNAFRLLEEFSGAGGKSTAHPQPGCSPPSFFCRSLPRFPAFIEAAFATSFYHHYFHPPASTVALGCCILFMGG